jgi:hypothetical protein
MRVAADEFLVNLARHVVEIEMAGFGRHLRMHDDVQEQVAQFLAHVREIAAVKGVEQFGDLLDKAIADALVGLLAVPGAAAGAAQPRHRLAQIVNRTHVVASFTMD